MKGGNGVSVSERNYAFAVRRTLRRVQLFWFAFGELRNYAPVGRFVTAFHSISTPYYNDNPFRRYMEPAAAVFVGVESGF